MTPNFKYLVLKELNLRPHEIFLVGFQNETPPENYSLQIWKDEVVLGETKNIEIKKIKGRVSYWALLFRDVKFIFDIDALFQNQIDATIQVKLIEKNNQNSIVEEEFIIHLFYYTYENSKQYLVQRRQNTLGTINGHIFSYSFEAIYSKNQDHSELLSELGLRKKQSKYGVKVTQPDGINPINTILTINSFNKVLGDQQKPKDIDKSKLYFEINQEEEEEEDHFIDIKRSYQYQQKNSENTSEDNEDAQLAHQIKIQSKNILRWFFYFASFFVILHLMHPTPKC